ncbi:hypothetical protein [Sphaerisporangium krabiense]|uniref:ABC-type enterobactin transport system permease subunit n=1 Tax=Sphaerisporangium krabiense TaxID=763782 RepID=A0A7W9DPL7_9ACTN|nr:hypothetical protein [Sphaerisporangium krabiense]MBB5626483.1 ABC-type enterobactin transport system permease subunit [Sphaerisporangium krabiense]
MLVQTVAQLTGTALGMLLRRPAVACLATIVFPMGTWLLLSSVQSFHPAQAWLAPYATARILLSGQMTLLTWTQWIVVLLIWGVTLNTAAATWLKRRRQLWQSPRTA